MIGFMFLKIYFGCCIKNGCWGMGRTKTELVVSNTNKT